MGLLQVNVQVGSMTDEGANNGGIDFAWRVHGALDAWTSKVDTKASIALGIETAVLGFVISLSVNKGPLSALDRTPLLLYRIGLLLLVLALVLVLGVVMPQLDRRGAKRDWQNNMIYFGHLRRWDVAKLAEALSTGAARHHQLARQLVKMSQIAWRKHVWLQWSLVLLVLGSGCLGLAGL